MWADDQKLEFYLEYVAATSQKTAKTTELLFIEKISL